MCSVLVWFMDSQWAAHIKIRCVPGEELLSLLELGKPPESSYRWELAAGDKRWEGMWGRLDPGTHPAPGGAFPDELRSKVNRGGLVMPIR